MLESLLVQIDIEILMQRRLVLCVAEEEDDGVILFKWCMVILLFTRRYRDFITKIKVDWRFWLCSFNNAYISVVEYLKILANIQI